MTNKEAYQVVLGQIEHDMEHKPDYTISKQEQDYWDELKEAYDIIFNNFILINAGATITTKETTNIELAKYEYEQDK